MGEVKFRNIGDIEDFEKIPLEKRLDVFNTSDLIKRGGQNTRLFGCHHS